MEMAAIHATDLSKSFGEGEAATMAVRNATFDARYGEILFIVGPSGSGKTTLLSMISGILKPTSGEVVVKGTNLWQMSADELAEFRLKTIGFVFQDFHLFPRLTTAENVAIPLVLRHQDWDAAVVKGIRSLEIVGLKSRAGLASVKLSGGEQQRVAIARAHPHSARPRIQVTFTSLTGYGLGTGLCALMITVARLRLPDYAALITLGNLGLALGMAIFIAAISSYISIRKVLRVEPFDIFRG